MDKQELAFSLLISYILRFNVRNKNYLGGSHGLVVMGDDSYEGRGFKTRRRILDGHFLIELL